MLISFVAADIIVVKVNKKNNFTCKFQDVFEFLFTKDPNLEQKLKSQYDPHNLYWCFQFQPESVIAYR